MEQLPFELNLKILSWIERPQYIHHNDSAEYIRTMATLSRLSKRWNAIAVQYLWVPTIFTQETVVVNRGNLLSFVYSLLSSVHYDIQVKLPNSTLLEEVDLQIDRIVELYSPQNICHVAEPKLYEEGGNSLEIEDVRIEFERRLKRAIFEASVDFSLDSIEKKHFYGKGIYVKNIWIPSDDPLMEALKYIFPWIPNCQRFIFIDIALNSAILIMVCTV